MKILFIRYKKSRNILEGGEQVSRKNYNVLCSLAGEENVDTYYIHDENVRMRLLDYVRGGFWFLFNYYFGLTPQRVRKMVAMADAYDVVFVDRSVFGIYARALKKSGYKGRVICFFHNVEVPYFKAKLGRKPGRGAVLRCIDANDGYSCRYADKIICLNPRDGEEIFARYGRRADVLIPVAFKDKYAEGALRAAAQGKMTDNKPLCLFLGAYFPPNNEGIEWFMQNVYPQVDVRVKIVGKGMGRLRENYKIPDEAEVIADAPDLLPYFEEADLMVLPIFSGSGMKVKTCESLMYGKNIIATDEAFEGYELDYERVGAKCNTAEEFIACLRDFAANPRPRFNAYARQFFLQYHTEEAVTEKFRQVLTD